MSEGMCWRCERLAGVVSEVGFEVGLEEEEEEEAWAEEDMVAIRPNLGATVWRCDGVVSVRIW